MLKILVAEDHCLFRSAVCDALRSQSFQRQILEAENGVQAIQLCKNEKVDLLVLDIGLPKLDGIAVIKQLKKEAATSKIKILVLSIYNRPSFVANLFKLGVNGYLPKDCDIEELQNAVRSLIFERTYGFPSTVTHGNEITKDDYLPPIKLTYNETFLLESLSQGLNSKQIANRLGISTRTVETRRARLEKKMRVANTAALLDYAYTHGILGIETH